MMDWWTLTVIFSILALIAIIAILVFIPRDKPIAKEQPACNHIADAAQAVATAEYQRLDVERAIAMAECIVRGEESE